MFDNLPGPSSITETLASGAKAISKEYQALFPGYYTLQKCFETLQEIRALLDGLSEHRRRKIMIASERGFCLPLRSLELDLDRLVGDFRELCRSYERSSPFRRYFPSKQFQADVAMLEVRIRGFYQDAWKTTELGDRSINWGTMYKMDTA